MENGIINVGFEKFLKRFKRSLERIIDGNLLNRVLIVVTFNSTKLYLIENLDNLYIRRLFRNNYYNELNSYLVNAGIKEVYEEDLPFNYPVTSSSCLYIISSKELKKL